MKTSADIVRENGENVVKFLRVLSFDVMVLALHVIVDKIVIVTELKKDGPIMDKRKTFPIFSLLTLFFVDSRCNLLFLAIYDHFVVKIQSKQQL